MVGRYVGGSQASDLPAVGAGTASSLEDEHLRVLIMDDSEQVRSVLRRGLRKFCEIVGELSDGSAAVARVEETRPHVVVTDIQMPVVDGVQATAAIKARFDDVVILGYTGDVDSVGALRAAGADEVYLKPHAGPVFESIQRLASRLQDQSARNARSPMHPNEFILRREYDARACGDLTALEAVLHEDVVWRVPGRSAISGTYCGRAAVMEYARRQDLADGTFQITVHAILADNLYGLVIATGRAQRGGRSHEWRAHGLYGFEDGKIKECRVLPEDQYAFDEIWS